MSFRAIRIAIACSALFIGATPALAQQMSDSYNFLDAVRKDDTGKYTKMANEPGSTIVNTKDRNTGETALHILARKGEALYLRFMLQKNANPNAQDRQGNTPLMIAVSQNFGEGVAILVRYRANVNLANSSGETPLIRAVQMRNVDMIRALLDAGADPDKADIIAGMSARDYAKNDRRSPTVRKLLEDAPKGGANSAAMGPRN